MSEFGFTNDREVFDAVAAFRDAAIADGWIATPIYPSHEGIDRATSLTRDGYKMQVLTRTKTGKWLFEAIINIWGPDGLAIKTPDSYSMKSLTEGLRVCGRCGKSGVETYRVAFANRCCAECLLPARAELEKPGWYN